MHCIDRSFCHFAAVSKPSTVQRRRRSAPIAFPLAVQLAAVLLLAALPAVHAQTAAAPPQSSDVQSPDTQSPDTQSPDTTGIDAGSIEIRLSALDGGNQPVSDLDAGDLTLTVDGRRVPVEIVGRPLAGPLRRLDPPWDVVLYFDHGLAGDSTLRRAALAFTEAARQLTDLGTVEVVRAQPEPRVMLPATRDPLLLDSSLSQGAIRASQGRSSQGTEDGGRDELRTRRRQFLQQVERLRSDDSVLSSPAASSLADRVREAMAEEQAVLRRQVDHLLTWVASRPLPASGERRLLFWITDGFDLEPERFYLDVLPADQAEQLRRSGAVPDLSGIVLDLARTLSIYGWTTVPVVFGPLQIEQAPAQDAYDLEDFEAATRDAPTAVPWVSVSLESLRRRLQGEEETPQASDAPVLLDAQAAMRTLARITGGAPVVDPRQLIPVLEEQARVWTLRVPLPRVAEGALPRSAEGALAVRIDSRLDRRGGELNLRNRAWVSRTPPESVAAARVRRMLRGELEDGRLEMLSSLQLDSAADEAPSGVRSGLLQARADLTPLAEPSINNSRQSPRQQTNVRVTYGLASADGTTLRLLHEVRNVGGLAQQQDWLVEREVELPAGTDRIVVLVEDLESSIWGGTLAAVSGSGATSELAQAAEATARPARDDSLLARPKAIRLLAPNEEVLRGRVTFEARVQSSIVQRVVFFLDGEQVAEVDAPPYEARIRLGNLPQRRTLWVVGYGPAGQEVGRDILLINDAGGNFRVFLTQPSQLQPGPTDVAVDVSVPVGRRLDRVELSWNDQLLATLYGPPLRQRVVLPNTDGFLRAAAYLDDGRMAEDVLISDDPDFAERVSIRLVELYTVVTDAEGKPVQGLTAEDFVVKENGRLQAVEAFEDAGSLPLTLGLAIDSSASMFVKLPAVQQAAGDFVRAVLSERDEAFLVDFDTDPRLARELSGDLKRLVTGIDSLKANGDSDLWEAVVFSLLELQAVRGKKALVLFSDGAVEDEEMPYRTCYQLAQRAGVPIYLIVLHPGVARGDDLSLGMRNFTGRLDRLAEASGGRVYYLPNTHNLGEIYQEIERELRSQYLLGYYPANPGDESSWREVEVELPNHPKLRARTIAGYFPQP